MIPMYSLNLLTFHQRQERRCMHDVGVVCAWGWAGFALYLIAWGWR